MDLCLVSVFKNESHCIREWIDHYIKEGVDHFFLVDNKSTDNYNIKDYIKSGIVDLTVNPKKHAQQELLNHYLDDAKKYTWIMVVDLDEFMYARNGYSTIKKYLQTVKHPVEQIFVLWKQFGSSGFKKQPNSIINNFVYRKKYRDHWFDDSDTTEIKSIVRSSCVNQLDLHIHNQPLHIHSSNNTRIDLIFQQISEEILRTSCLHINHYRIQSLEFYSTVKMKRGDAFSNNVRDMEMFRHQDTNEIVDTELKDKRYPKKHRKRTMRKKPTLN